MTRGPVYLPPCWRFPVLALVISVTSVACGKEGGGAQLETPSKQVEAPSNPSSSVEANVILDPSQTFQKINGWMANPASDWNYTPRLRDAIVAALVEDLGVTRIRLDTSGTIEGNGEPGVRTGVAVNDDSDPRTTNLDGFSWTGWDRRVSDWVLPIKRKVEARGEPFVLQVTYNGHARSTLFQKNPAEYAEFVSAVLHRLRSEWGVELDLWDVANEPDNPVTKNGEELRSMLRAAGDRARAEGFDKVMFVGPSVTDADNAVSRLRPMLAVRGTARYLAEATYHRYRHGATLANLHAIRDLARAHGLRTAQTEFIGADHEMLYEDLTEADVSSWTQYTIAFCGRGCAQASTETPSARDARQDRGGVLYRVVDLAAGTFEPGSRTWFLRQYFRYIRPGAVRIGARSTDPDLIRPVAFRNRDGNVVVVANTTGKATLRISGLPEGAYRVTFATREQRGGAGAPVTIGAGETLAATIPAEGVVTVSR